MVETNDIFNILHNAVESKYMGKKISHATMAKKLGVSMRTYQDWRLGTTKPQAALAGEGFGECASLPSPSGGGRPGKHSPRKRFIAFWSYNRWKSPLRRALFYANI